MKVVLDPGHGGNDTGAVGPTGLEEANTVLDLSEQIAIPLQHAGIDIRFTREIDVFVELEDRCAIANVWGADYFVSVHLNSNGSTAVGIETLYKSETGKKLATPVQEILITATGDTNRGLKKRDDLYVLNGTKMPAILVEAGFISHPKTEAKFKTGEYRRTVAHAVAAGILKFLGLSVPPTTPPPLA